MVGAIGYLVGALFLAVSSIGYGTATVVLLRDGRARLLELLLWTVFLFWQMVPVLFEGFSPGLNFREVARYPVSFRLYFLLNAAYGLFDPAAVAGLLWLSSIWLGILFVHPGWALKAGALFLAFAAFNVLSNRIVIGMLERFQSTRKGRERVAAVLLLLMLLPQMLNLMVNGWINVSRLHLPPWTGGLILKLDRISPPGLIAQALLPSEGPMIVPLALFLAYSLIVIWLFDRRLRAIFQGEIYAETFTARHELKVKPGWRLPGFEEAVSAIVEKEMVYLRQNVRLLLLLAYPVIIFSFLALGGPARKGFSLSPVAILGGFAGFLALSVSNLASNTFGMDREGFGRWLLSPLPLRKVIFAKSLTQAAILLALYLTGATIIAGAKHIPWTMFLAITAGFLCILTLLMGAGSVISVYWPKRIEPAQMSSRLVSQAAGLASFVVTLLVMAVTSIVVFTSWYWKLPWLPLLAGLVGLALSLKLYSYLLTWAVRHAEDHLEEIAGTLGA
ncbi:MAG TPA: hypothetical protein VKD24_10095 [Candidatus Angelobacter sp.]|nr:hypothetical protein [Candidatus Angelobacter sp.]